MTLKYTTTRTASPKAFEFVQKALQIEKVLKPLSLAERDELIAFVYRQLAIEESAGAS